MAENTEPQVEAKLTLKGVAEKVDKLTDALTVLLQNQQVDKPTGSAVPKSAPVEGESDFQMIPPAFRKIVNEELGEDFGINIVWPGDNNNNGVLFKVIVPDVKSNMTKNEREMKRVDVRTRNLAGNPTPDEVRKFCQKIKANLLRTQQVTLAK